MFPSSSSWAWCSVNTRSVFMSHPSSDFLFGQDVYALAPFLDLLNHRPDVQVNYRKHYYKLCVKALSVECIMSLFKVHTLRLNKDSITLKYNQTHKRTYL